jgi:hypothetical protein
VVQLLHRQVSIYRIDYSGHGQRGPLRVQQAEPLDMRWQRQRTMHLLHGPISTCQVLLFALGMSDVAAYSVWHPSAAGTC